MEIYKVSTKFFKDKTEAGDFANKIRTSENLRLLSYGRTGRSNGLYYFVKYREA